jgi:serine/threonine protein kinase
MKAADRLESLTLEGGWTVVERITPKTTATGGRFSVGYRVKDPSGKIAYLKALDFSEAFQHPDFTLKLEDMLHAYNFEVDILKQCGDKHLTRVVKALAYGTATVPSLPLPACKVPYIIFEEAEGDIRPEVGFFQAFDFAFGMRMLHHSAVGLQQLHQHGIAHQDVKPSNVLLFGEDGAKLADLGCASLDGTESPRDDHIIAGDVGYAPPDRFYKQLAAASMEERFIGDIYLFGNLLFFLFLDCSATQAIASKMKSLGIELSSDLVRDMAYFNHAMSKVLEDLRNSISSLTMSISNRLSEDITQELVNIASELCEPDPSKRGDPIAKQRGWQRFSLMRYISRLDLLAKKAEFYLK